MTEDRQPLAELLAEAGDGDFLLSVAEAVLQLLMETDVEGLIGAGRHERTAERTTYRNGYRDRTLDTLLGSLQLRLPKLRQGSYFPDEGRQPAGFSAACSAPSCCRWDAAIAAGLLPSQQLESEKPQRRKPSCQFGQKRTCSSLLADPSAPCKPIWRRLAMAPILAMRARKTTTLRSRRICGLVNSTQSSDHLSR